MGYLRALLMKAFGRLVPVRSDTLRSQFNLLEAFVHYLAKAEISYLDFSIMEYYVLRLQIKMYYFLLAIIQILQSAEDLRDYQLGFFLWYLSILLQIKVQIWPRA